MVSRRSILRAATGVAALAPLAVAIDALAEDADPPAGATSVPETLAHHRTGLVNGSQVAEAAFPLTHLAVAAVGPTAVRLRTPAGWSDWREVRGCAPGDDTTAAGDVVLAAPGAVGYELRVAGGGTAAALELNTVDGPQRTTAPGPGQLPLLDAPAGPGARTPAGAPAA